MKHSKIIAIVFTAVNIILIAVCGIFFFRADRTKPEFKFQVSDFIYREGTGTKELLENITASDREDGDVTDRIVVEKIVRSSQENSVVVFYAVSDKAGNVAKISRAFPAEPDQKDIEAAETDRSTDAVGGEEDPQASPEDGGAIPGADTEDASGEETGENADGTEEHNAGETGRENGREVMDAGPEDEKADETQTEGGDVRPEPAQGSEADAGQNRPEPAQNPPADEGEDKGKAPVLTLKNPEVTIPVGTAPAWVDVIGSLSDDRDSYETLFYNLSVSKFDVNKAGTYKVALTTKDSDGNKSDAVTLTIHVK